jgi:hypothetical protein
MSKFSHFSFGNPTNKTVIGTAYTWELLIANHLDQSEILSRSQVQFITLFFAGAQLCSAFYQPRQVVQIWHNTFYCLESHTEHWWRTLTCYTYGHINQPADLQSSQYNQYTGRASS